MTASAQPKETAEAQPIPAESWAQPLASLATRPLRFLNETFLRQRPPSRWTTPNCVVSQDDAHRLRDFSPHPDAPSTVPLLIVPPEVNRSNIVDFGPGQSLVQSALDHGFARVAAIEWRDVKHSAAAGRRDIDDSVATILDAIATLGGRVHLLGVCQGGWEAAIAAALAPDATASLTLVAAPIDFHAGSGAVKEVSRLMPMVAYRNLVARGRGSMPGELISAGFDLLSPFERFCVTPFTVWARLDDGGWMRRHHQLQDWYRSPKNLPGPLYLRAVRELFKENRLIQGRLVACGRTVELASISCPLCLVTGRRDHITPPPQLLAVRQAVSSRRVHEVQTDGGHIGTFMGSAELRENWPGIFEWLRSQGGD
jgi:poly(3-hydroxybutyrate) depolymerase